jgi:serine phosphatase RsbU (regulator of sigma subunit)
VISPRRRRGAGLMLKFSLLVGVLVILVVAGVIVPILLRMIPREQLTLAAGLQDRALILLDSVASRAAAPVAAGRFEYGTVTAFTRETATMPGEALWIAITGPGSPDRDGAPEREDPADRDYLLAANDEAFPDTARLGKVPFPEPLLGGTTVKEIAARVNLLALEKLGGSVSDGEQSKEKARVDRVLLEAASAPEVSGSDPPFDPAKLADEYLFYRPLVSSDPAGAFFIGMLRIEVSTAVVRGQVSDAVNGLIRVSGFIAILAIAAGIAGAVLLASIAVNPVRRLVKTVSELQNKVDYVRTSDAREEDSKTSHAGRTRDELATLTDTVDGMTRNLVAAAIAERQMLLGRAIQKQFLPLEHGSDKKKGSTGGLKNPAVELYAYYEGAATVSGDYFDWQQLDDRYLAVIKCDVSGHGVEAAFIMVEVATLFLKWSREWKSRLAVAAGTGRVAELAKAYQDLLKLDSLAYTINDMIEERGFGGKFAALIVCLYDVRTGAVAACNAGDNKLYAWDADQANVVTRTINPESPAAGAFPSMLVEGKSGFPTLRHQLDRDDVLVLFTDGFEESERHFRDASGGRIVCTDDSHTDKDHDPLSTHKKGDHGEEMSVPRVLEIFNAYFRRGTYRLVRNHLVDPEELAFDFSTCTGTLEEAVLALVAVERVFRTYRDPSTGPEDSISLEVQVNDFLEKHFLQYRAYFPEKTRGERTGDLVKINGIKEDIQKDDLTVVLLRRP